jgi:hypothetical protein
MSTILTAVVVTKFDDDPVTLLEHGRDGRKPALARVRARGAARDRVVHDSHVHVVPEVHAPPCGPCRHASALSGAPPRQMRRFPPSLFPFAVIVESPARYNTGAAAEAASATVANPRRCRTEAESMVSRCWWVTVRCTSGNGRMGACTLDRVVIYHTYWFRLEVPWCQVPEKQSLGGLRSRRKGSARDHDGVV